MMMWDFLMLENKAVDVEPCLVLYRSEPSSHTFFISTHQIGATFCDVLYVMTIDFMEQGFIHNMIWTFRLMFLHWFFPFTSRHLLIMTFTHLEWRCCFYDKFNIFIYGGRGYEVNSYCSLYVNWLNEKGMPSYH